MQNTGGSSLALGPIAGNMGEVRYDLDEQMRAFLLPVNLTDFVFSGEYLHLPRMEASTPSPRIVTIVPDDTPKWQSFRVYDAGACSQLQPWSALAPVLVQGLTDGFVQSPRVRNGSRVGEARVLPILHATGADGRILNVDDDRIAIHAEFHADRISEPIGTVGCDNVTVTINIEVGFRRSPGVLEFPPCSSSGGALLLDDGFSFDFDGVVHSVRVNHDSEGCALSDVITSGLGDNIAESLPDSVVRAIQAATLRDPIEVGYDVTEVRPCACDTDCNEFGFGGPAYPGRRHRCVFPDGASVGECWIQLEPDRLNVRPDGLEVVLEEARADPQDVVFRRNPLVAALLCGNQRGAVDIPLAPLRGQLGPVIVPPP